MKSEHKLLRDITDNELSNNLQPIVYDLYTIAFYITVEY